MSIVSPSISESRICQELEWDSAFFGFKIGSVIPNCLDHEQMLQILDWATSRHVRCLYLLADADAPTVGLAEKHRFQLMDVRVTLSRELEEHRTEIGSSDIAVVRPACAGDIPVLRAIAATCYTDSRFYRDTNFPRARCEELYSTWIEKSCNGFADNVLVAEVSRRPVGYISCHLLDGQRAQIGLVGVAREHRNIGLGQILLAHALGWLSARSAKNITVVTQGLNVNAQRLYQRNGFVTRSMQLWYHLWLQHGENTDSVRRFR